MTVHSICYVFVGFVLQLLLLHLFLLCFFLELLVLKVFVSVAVVLELKFYSVQNNCQQLSAPLFYSCVKLLECT